MKRKHKLYIAIGVLLIAFSLIVGFMFIVIDQVKDIDLPEYLTTPTGINTSIQQTATLAPIQTTEITATPAVTTTTELTVEPTTPTFEPTKPPYASDTDSQVIAKITVDTNRKTRTYDVMPDADEETLKHDLGHLPTSVMPGQEGLCVIMGHRDTQFSILKYCEIGDKITIKIDERFYTYTINNIEIIESDSALQFDAVNGVNLALVTCYPFRYTGHAPQKIIVYAELK